MNNGPLISVVIPTYNRAEQTIEAIESVLAQTYSGREIVVIDDGSTDGSSETIQRFLSQNTKGNDPGQQLHYLRQTHQGQSVARNAGIEKARGEYIAFLDSDDIWLPEKLEWQVRTIHQFKDQCGACFTDAQEVDKSGAVTGSFANHGRHYKQVTGIESDTTNLFANSLRSFCGIWTSTLLIRADLIGQIGGFDPAISFHEDTDLFLRLSQVTCFAYVNKPFALMDRRIRPNDSDVRPWLNAEVRFRERQYVFEKWLRLAPPLPPDVRRATAQSLKVIHSQCANWYFETREYDKARQSVSRAIKCELTFGLSVKWVLVWLAPALVRRISAKTTPYL